MIKHIVFWRFAPENKSENMQKARDMLLALPAVVPEICTFEVGQNCSDGEFAYDMALMSTFNDAESLERYQQNPDHRQVSAFIRSVISERAVVDYDA